MSAEQTTKNAIARIDGAEFYRVHDSISKVVIDFAFGADSDMPLRDRARSGKWASSVVVDTVNDEVTSGALRYGSMGLPEGADLFVAKSEVAGLLEQSSPPGSVTVLPFEDEASFLVRWRDMAGMKDTLREEGTDILHVTIQSRVPADAFASWLVQFTRLYRDNLADIRQKTIEVST